MKEFAVLLLLALMLNGCGNNHVANPQVAAGGVWLSEMEGGDGLGSGLSFVAQFTVANNGAMNFTSFQFLTQIDGGCFPVTGPRPTGTLTVTPNAANQVSGTFSLTVVSTGNTLTMTSTSVTGTLNGVNDTLADGVIIGNWALKGATGCNTNGTFTMTQTTSN
ncbi:MAG TPA: hypothetical protein VFF50_14315 [Candidatus Deferrimicrobiaceae bacterium]|nr:hypothetical protein [Candidatus Deferrimicrobiaceae bacterium]